MVKFKKTVAVGMFAAALAVGAVALHSSPSVTAYAEEGTTTAPGASTEKETATCDFYAALTYDDTVLTGNYIYVAYYTDKECTKLKSLAVYTKSELTDKQIPLGSLNLKKGGFFKVYDELTDAKDVKVVEVKEQAPKIKVKVVDITKDTIFEALEITVDGTKVDATALSKYNISLMTDGGIGGQLEAPSTAEEGTTTTPAAKDALLTQLKLAARANGLTVYANVSVKGENGMPSEAKFKLSAVPKAPKVTIDYVNGAYTISKANYIITTVDSDGKIAIPADTATWTTVDKKVALSIDDILKTAAGESAAAPADAAAIIVQAPASGKKAASMQAVYKVEKLDTLTFTADTTDTSKGSASVTVDGTPTEVATFVFTKTGVTITAKKDIAYYDSAKSKWVIVKKDKSTKEIALANGGTAKLKIKVLGVKGSKTEDPKFGSGEAEVTNSFVEPTDTPTPTPTTAASGG